MAHFFKLRARSFRYAFEGGWYVVRTQPNIWIHALITSLVIALTIWLQLSLTNWAILLLTITLVWMAEFFNTALETVVDLASPQIHPLAKIGKDVAAAAVLMTAIAAVLIGLLILGPPLWARLHLIFST